MTSPIQLDCQVQNPVDWRAELFPARDFDHRQFVRSRQRQAISVEIFDTIGLQLRDLIRCRNPRRRLSAAEIESLTREHLNGLSTDEYGVWAYYPWSRRLVHLLDEAEFAELRTNRNCYKITPAEQQELATKKIGIIGLSVGQSVAAVLALERSFGELRLADFDTLDLSNLNRIRAGVHCLGIPKVYVTAREIAEIDPFLKVTPFIDGVTGGNLEEFILAGGQLDLIVEECDSLDIKVLVRERARAHRIPVVMDTSDRGMLDIERFDLEPNRPLFHGLAGDLQASELRGLTNEEKVTHVLRILNAETLSPRLRASLLEVEQSISTWPQLGSSVSAGGAAAADAVRRINLGQSRESGRWFLDPETAGGPAGHCATITGNLPAPRKTPVNQVWSEFVSAAVLAPSGGNAQPWQWVVSAAGGLDLYLDRSRSSGLVDFEYGGSYLALGCAVENLVLSAHASGFDVQMREFPSPADSGHVASFRLAPAGAPHVELHWRDELHAEIGARQTNRNLGREQQVETAELRYLFEAVNSVPGARLQIATDGAALDNVAEWVGAADRIRFLNPVMHRELLSEIRWSAAEAEQQRDGIDIETLSLSASDRAGLELCRDWSSLEILSQMHRGRGLGKMAGKQIKSAAGVGLISMGGFRPRDYFRAGRAVERMWLAAAKAGVAIHPMTALVYFFARVVRGGGAGFPDEQVSELREIRTRFASVFHVTPWAGEVLLFRFGSTDNQVKRSLRRPLDDVLFVE